ncbi:MAG: ABC-type transport auxiliary lipoprotein family protein [Desulfuromonadaceae bacterium]|nr:ABC-type transport auxiliary lipoprotein family protein [Desulfuromonadaceae bacterium]
MFSIRYRHLPWLILPALFLLTGCLRLEKPYPQKSAYRLEAIPATTTQQPLSNRVLQIGKFDSAPAYRSKGFIYRTGEQTWQSDYYHEFFTPPTAMLTEQCRRWLQQTGLFGQINQGGYPLASDLLQGRIVALHGDYRPGRAPMAVLELQLTLINESRTPAHTDLNRLYRRSLPLVDREPATLVKAWNEALADILREFEAQLRLDQNSLTQKQDPAQ